MCGIVGYVGPKKVRPLLMEGPEKLEYRGYDSAGISAAAGDRVDALRAVGNLAALRSAIAARQQADWMPAPLLAVIPLQLLACHIARLRGLNVDQPRNLAKTVTVE
jgi:glucosamine 6-phosphate synthetase-like amidotransferase/phosphosugar isomerase protein